MSLDLTPIGPVSDLLKTGISTALQVHEEFQAPGIVDEMTEAALAAARAHFAKTEAAFQANPTDPKAIAEEEKELS